MSGDAADPLLLGQRVVAILEAGLRTATYKLATLMALIEHCIENMPERPGDVLRVPIPILRILSSWFGWSVAYSTAAAFSAYDRNSVYVANGLSVSSA